MCPINVLDICKNIVEREKPVCQNLGLCFNFYTDWDSSNKSDVKDILEPLPETTTGLGDMLDAWKQRRITQLNSVHNMGYSCRYTCKGVRTMSRLASGMGNPNPNENGLTFQFPLGFPIVPASSQKGVVKNYAFLFEEKDKKDKDAIRIFGDKDTGRGGVFFFDAFPLPGIAPFLEADVMTPHYTSYYSSKGEEPPADYNSPKIIYFLSVPANMPFFFSMAALTKEDLNMAWSWLKNVLFEVGIGSKTRSGYGRFYMEDFDNHVDI